MSITNMVAFCTVAAILALVLRQYKPEFALLLTMACGVVVLLFLMDGFAQIQAQLEDMLAGAPLPPQLLGTVFRGLGICILCEWGSSLCRDAGENAIALKVELAGKVAVMLISMPLFYELLQMAAGLLTV